MEKEENDYTENIEKESLSKVIFTEKPIEEGKFLDKVIWKGKPITGKVISIEKGVINFDYKSGKIQNFSGVMMHIQEGKNINEAGLPGHVEDYKEFLGKNVKYLYRKTELVSKESMNSTLRGWEYSIEEISKDNKIKGLKRNARFNS